MSYNGAADALLYGNITGDKKFWIVGSIFSLVGIFIAVVVPFLVTPHVSSDDILVQGEITGYTNVDEDTHAEIYQYTTREGVFYEEHNSIQSSSPAYKIHDQIEIYYDKSHPEKSWIKDDQNLVLLKYVLYILGGYFFLLGIAIILLKASKMPDVKIDMIIGTIGALSYGIPAVLTFPGLYYAYLNKPNFFFSKDINSFPQDSMIIGLVFMLTGIIDILAVVFMIRNYQKTGSNTFTMRKDL